MPLFFGRPRPVPAASTHLLPLIVLLLAVFACYANSLSNGFVMDDYYIIQLNRDTFTLKSIVTAFTSPDYLVNAQPTPYYRPLNRLSYILEQEFFGVNPLGYHAVSIALHGLGVVLLYLVLFSLGCARLPALAAALLFGVHPVNAEAVNFIAARNNILASVFVLGSYLALLHAEETRGWRGYLLSGFLFFLGVLSKETAVMFLPFIFVVRTLRPGAADRRILLKAETGYLLPYLGFLVLYAVLRTMALDQTPNLAGLSQRIWKLVYIVPRYFSQVVFPNDLSVHYIVPDNLATIAVPLLAGWVVMAAALCCLLRVRTPAIEFGLAWLGLNFLPISSIVPIPSTPMADRYLYLPLIG
ncbi:MAG TPA: glycosyltransferase family 39 protein, partial [Geobacteraceae bacterium]